MFGRVVLAAVILCALAVAACAPEQIPVPEPGEVVGTWTYSKPESGNLEEESPPSAVVDIRADGTVTIREFPKPGFPDSVIFGPGTSTTGTWQISQHLPEGEGLYDGQPGIAFLLVDPASPTGTRTALHLAVKGSGESLRLFTSLGDPDLYQVKQYVLTKTR